MVRLPVPGNDPETWGEILNEFLSVGHADDGHHRMGLVVTEFGADSTGLTDTAAAINAVIQDSDVGDAIVFPGGEYQLEEPILLLADRNYVGFGNPVLRRKASTAMGDGVIMVDPSAPAPVSNILFAGITVDGNSANNATWPVTGSPSVFANLTATGNITGWYASGPCVVAYDAAVFRTLAGSVRITNNADGPVACTTTVLSGQGIPAVPGRSYTWSAWARAAATGRSFTCAIQWYNGAAVLQSTSTGTAQVDNNAGWTQATVTGVCPPTATQFAVRVTFTGTLNTEVHYVDDGTVTHTLVGGHNLYLEEISDSVFQNVASLNACSYGLQITGNIGPAFNNRVIDCEIRDAENSGVFLAADAEDNQISRCVIADNLTGAEISGPRNSLVECQVSDNGLSGITVFSGQALIADNRIMLNGRYGIYVGAFGDYITVANNEIYANSIESSGTYAAILFDGASAPRNVLYPQVLGNVIISNVPAYTSGAQHSLAVSLGDHDGAVVDGNSVQLQAAGGLPSTALQVTGLKAGDIVNGVAWTSNLHAQHNYPPGTVLAALRQTTLQSTANGGVATALTFTTEDRDLLAAHDNSTNPSRWTCPITGWYTLTGAIGYAADGTGNYRGSQWLLNGTAIAGSYTSQRTHNTEPTMVNARATPVLITAGQYVELAAYHDGTGAVNTTVAVTGHQSRMTVTAA